MFLLYRTAIARATNFYNHLNPSSIPFDKMRKICYPSNRNYKVSASKDSSDFDGSHRATYGRLQQHAGALPFCKEKAPTVRRRWGFVVYGESYSKRMTRH